MLIKRNIVSKLEIETIHDYGTLSTSEYDNKYHIQCLLHDWTIEHFRGENLPFDYDIHAAFIDHKRFRKSDRTYPATMTPQQLHFEVITMIIEADGGNPF